MNNSEPIPGAVPQEVGRTRDQQPESEKRYQRFIYGVTEDIGRRPSMEDAHAVVTNLGGKNGRDFIAIYDGHGGSRAAELASVDLHKFFLQELAKGKTPEKALSDAFEITDEKIEVQMDDGATAIVALIDDNKLIVAGAGDARAVLDRGGKARRLSRDHKPGDPAEKQRIEKNGGFVRTGDVPRVNGVLAVARALGDREFGKLVPPTPDITTTDFSPGDGKLILACDGVWDVISDQEAVDLIKNISNPNDASRRLKDEALRRGSSDNVSVIVAVPSRADDMSALIVEAGGNTKSKANETTNLGMGSVVRVQRTSGLIEAGWEITGFAPQTGEAIVTKNEGGRWLEKQVPIPMLERLNRPAVVGDIETAENIPQLIDTIGRLDGLQGSTQFYSSSQLGELVNRVLAGKDSLQVLTRTGGLRDKVEELMREQKQSGFKGIVNRLTGK